jgi:hypothetical protein
MRTSETTSELLKAMIAAAPEISSIPKTKMAKGENYIGYKYATLDCLIDMLRAILPKHGLWFIQMPYREGDKSCLTTRVIHSSGEWMEDTIEMTDTELRGKVNDTQKIGASITYYRRYALSAIFGVAADEDVDGNVNNIQRPAAKPQTQARPAEAKPQPQQKKDPTPYLEADFKKRIESGETEESILKNYADILKTDAVRKISELNAAEKSTLANSIYKANKEKENA